MTVVRRPCASSGRRTRWQWASACSAGVVAPPGRGGLRRRSAAVAAQIAGHGGRIRRGACPALGAATGVDCSSSSMSARTSVARVGCSRRVHGVGADRVQRGARVQPDARSALGHHRRVRVPAVEARAPAAGVAAGALDLLLCRSATYKLSRVGVKDLAALRRRPSRVPRGIRSTGQAQRGGSLKRLSSAAIGRCSSAPTARSVGRDGLPSRFTFWSVAGDILAASLCRRWCAQASVRDPAATVAMDPDSRARAPTPRPLSAPRAWRRRRSAASAASARC